jgi:hypothetical protein
MRHKGITVRGGAIKWHVRALCRLWDCHALGQWVCMICGPIGACAIKRNVLSGSWRWCYKVAWLRLLCGVLRVIGGVTLERLVCTWGGRCNRVAGLNWMGNEFGPVCRGAYMNQDVRSAEHHSIDN